MKSSKAKTPFLPGDLVEIIKTPAGADQHTPRPECLAAAWWWEK